MDLNRPSIVRVYHYVRGGKEHFEGGLGTGRFRTWAGHLRFFEGLELVEPSLLYVNDWRPDELTPTDSPVHTLQVGGIGRKS
ncbi:SAM-dependent methyltransferase [Pseudonocardia spinosispora]|uniref:SAM-dependent methyltransferase n=1 Tax=Pseudonocardia spinosispora TaxID=103441 RepID=UPI000408B429|nr:SAM-dependent methyltransferase [Pseudonocardia spinosispora]